MAAKTLTTRALNTVLSPYRVVMGTITMTNGDTWAVPGMKTVKNLDFMPTTNSSAGFTISTNTVTMVSGGSLTGQIMAIGY